LKTRKVTKPCLAKLIADSGHQNITEALLAALIQTDSLTSCGKYNSQNFNNHFCNLLHAKIEVRYMNVLPYFVAQKTIVDYRLIFSPLVTLKKGTYIKPCVTRESVNVSQLHQTNPR